VLFDDAGAQGDAGDGGGVVECMIRQPDKGTSAPRHVGERAQVVVRGRCGIAADAMQDHQLRASVAAGGLHGLGNFIRVGHAGRDDHRFAGRRDARDQRQIHRLERGDLVGRGAQAFEQVHGGGVKGRRKQGDVACPGAVEQCAVPVPWRVRLIIERVEAAPVPQTAGDLKVGLVTVQRDGVGAIGLDLDGCGAGGGGGVDQGEGAVQLAVVIGRQFGNHIRRMLWPDRAAVDFNLHLRSLVCGYVAGRTGPAWPGIIQRHRPSHAARIPDTQRWSAMVHCRREFRP